MTRRETLGAAALAAGCSAVPQRKGAPVIDTHVHCFAGAGDVRFPYAAAAPYRPEAAATPEHLLACMDGAGVTGAVVVHPEPYQDDHRYLEHCLGVGGGKLKGTVLVFADRAGELAALARRLPIVAARIHAYAPERLPPFGKPELRALWRAAAEAGLAIQLHFEPRYAPGFEPLIREFSGTTVLIDHLGRPLQGTREEHDLVVGWSRLPNTVMKLSGLQPPTQYPHRDIAPIVRRLAEVWGPDRLLWGGGFEAGATPAGYRAARERARALVSHLPPADQEKVFGGNAARIGF